MSIKEKLQQYIEAIEVAAPAAVPAEASKAQTSASSSSNDERKARTHRLIQVGAITDQYLETAGRSPEDIEILMQDLIQCPEVQQLLRHKSHQRKK